MSQDLLQSLWVTALLAGVTTLILMVMAPPLAGAFPSFFPTGFGSGGQRRKIPRKR